MVIWRSSNHHRRNCFRAGGRHSNRPRARHPQLAPSRLDLRFRRVPMPIPAIHPGEHLAEELEALDMRAAELARNIGVPTNRVTQILHGTRSITGDTALRLAHFFGTSTQFWLNLQNLYDLRLAQKKAGKSVKALPRLKRREFVHA